MNIRWLSNIFFTGLAVILPVVVTTWIVWWLGVTFETILGGLYTVLISDRFYFPGLGITLGIALTFGVGLLAKAWLFRTVFQWWDQILNRIPLVKTVYGATRDFIHSVSGSTDEKFNRVVLVKFDRPGIKLMGFVTREDLSRFPGLGEDDEVAVYLPLSYQIGGHTIFLPRSRLQALDMRAEDAMRFVLTAGLSGGRRVTADPPVSQALG